MCERKRCCKGQLVSAVRFRHGSFREWLGRRSSGVCHADIEPAKFAANIVDELTHALVIGNVERR